MTSTGVLVSFDRPIWASMGQSHGRSLVDEKAVTDKRDLSGEEFEAVVDLAYRMPDFGPEESSSREVVLYRLLRGLGVHWQDSGFLDFAIALEAALLKGTRTELSYKCALYGALFLQEEKSSSNTFSQLRKVYEARSKLVHGSGLKPGELAEATTSAKEIAVAVVLKALETGWPSTTRLDRLALKAVDPMV